MAGWIIISRDSLSFLMNTRFVVIKHGRLQHETLSIYIKKKNNLLSAREMTVHCLSRGKRGGSRLLSNSLYNSRVRFMFNQFLLSVRSSILSLRNSLLLTHFPTSFLISFSIPRFIPHDF